MSKDPGTVSELPVEADRTRFVHAARRLAGGILLLAALYALAGWLGLSVQQQLGISPVWPPSGIALALVLWLGYRVWPGIAIGIVLLGMSIGLGPAPILAGAVAQVTEALLAALVLRRLLGFRIDIERVRDVLALALVAAPLAAAVSASLGTGGFLLWGDVSPEGYSSAWFVWFIGDAVGILVLTPFVLMLRTLPRRALSRRRAGEAAVLIAAEIAACWVGFGFGGFGADSAVPPVYLPLPFVVWLSIRFGVRGAAAANTVLVAMAIAAGLADTGPFWSHAGTGTLVLQVLLIAVTAVTGLLVAAAADERRKAQGTLRHSEGLLRAVIDSLPVGVWVADCDGRLVMGNPMGREIWGGARYVGPEHYGEYRGWWVENGEPIGPDDWALARAVRDGETSLNELVEIEGFDGIRRIILNSAVPIRDAAGGISGAIVVNQDISARRRAEELTQKLSSAVEQTADIIMITDRDGVIEYVNPAFETTTGYSQNEVIGARPSVIKSDRHGRDFFQTLWRTVAAGGVYRDVVINRRKSGELFYEEKTITPLKDAQGRVTHFISTGKDITERMQAQERLQHLAHHDVLTLLPNRALFIERLDHALARTHRSHRSLAVLFLDLDRFKIINDTLGHDFGDRALRICSERLKACLREGDTVARLGGDEFTILLEDLASADDVPPVAQKILDALAQPFVVERREFFITTSIGISLGPADGADSQALLRNADTAMYRAKEQGRNKFQFYSADMSARAFQRLTLETSLRRAVERGEFLLYYQPQIDLIGGRVTGFEALLRWRHPELGLVEPAEFLPVAEETGLIRVIDEWVLHTACAQLRAWAAEGRHPGTLAVNLSGGRFSEPRFTDAVARLLREQCVPAAQLELEITESVIMRNDQETLDTLRELNAMGVRLAIDDFGTGYSSLSYLKRFPIDTLKIDRSFVMDITHDPDDAAIVTAVIALARSLDIRAVAEGVETGEQLAFLRARGCDGAQGYLFSHPVPAADAAPILDAPGMFARRSAGDHG
ncbi:MAG TPA: EAL domain-containing protein [Acidiferrobacterales bacterium]